MDSNPKKNKCHAQVCPRSLEENQFRFARTAATPRTRAKLSTWTAGRSS